MVAVRSTGYSFDSIIGYQDERGRNVPLVDERYLRTLVAITNDRFKTNTERIARFRNALMEGFRRSDGQVDALGKPLWEDADARKRRKREEGLARQLAQQGNGPALDEDVENGQNNIDGVDGIFQ
jgi:tRNA wybutosine-synthesizing protein 3